MRSLATLVAQQAPALMRGYAGAAGAVVPAGSPFLRFSNPYPTPVDHTPLLTTIPETQVTSLPNGMRVASEANPHAETATVGIWINSGSRFETDANNGTAHFLEHILFKGTKSRTVKDLEVEIENMGGSLNAYTGREQTCYYAKVMKRDVGKAVSILSDILLNSKLEERAIERERDVILREMEEVNKQTSELVFDHLHATAFQHSPLGRTILGPEANIRSITRANLVDYMASHYRGPRMVLAAAGAVDHDELVKAAGAAFGSVPDEERSVQQLVAADPALFTGSSVYDRRPDTEQCCFAVAWRGASWADPDSVPLMVMQTMLGGWDKNNTVGRHAGSLLTQKIATDELADAYMAFNTNYHDSGLFGVYAVTDRDRSAECSWTVMNEVTKLCYEVSEADVARARNQLKASLLFLQDSSQHVAESIGRELLVYGRRVPRAEMFARIDAVTADGVRGVADRFLYDQDVAIAAVGDTQFLGDYNWFRRRTYWIRY